MSLGLRIAKTIQNINYCGQLFLLIDFQRFLYFISFNSIDKMFTTGYMNDASVCAT